MKSLHPLLSPLIALGVAALAALPSAAGATSPSDWQKIDNPGPVIGADGKPHTATCSGYPGTDPRFSFWAKRGTSKNTMVFFEGGGACWDSLTCTFPLDSRVPPQVPQFFVPAIAAGTNPANYDGVFRTDRPDNPVHDWNIVYIPYCTGDLHAGSSTRTYFNVGNPVFPLPQTFDIQHRGFDNFMVVLDWMEKNIEKQPSKVLVTGSSAGGYGAAANFPWIQRAYPKARTFVIADASQGVTTRAFDAGTPGRGSWNMQLAPWALGNDAASVSGPELLRVAARNLPDVNVAQFTTALDSVQIQFYGVMKTYYAPGGSCPNPAIDWYQQMSGTLASYALDLPNFRHYVAAGEYHTIMRSPNFYTENSSGRGFDEWVRSMLKGHERKPGAWANEACETCLIAVSCP
jgi:hypothetical protein